MSTESRDFKSNPETRAESCPRCGMERMDWPTEGFKRENRQYCCQGCAEDTGCTCVTTGTSS